MTVRCAFGCLPPLTEINEWKNIFICLDIGTTSYFYQFQTDLMHMFGHSLSFDVIKNDYIKFINAGWIPMTPQELRRIRDTGIDDHTNLNPPI